MYISICKKKKNVITCPSTNSCGVFQPTHKQPTQIPIFCLSLHRNHGRCCAHTNFTKTHLAGGWWDHHHISWMFVRGCTWHIVLRLWCTWCACLSTRYAWELPKPSSPLMWRRKLRDSIMRTFLPNTCSRILPEHIWLLHSYCFLKSWWQVHAISSNENTPRRLKHEEKHKLNKQWKTGRNTNLFFVILGLFRLFLVFQTFPSVHHVSWLKDPLNCLRIAADHRQITGRSQANAAAGAVAVDFAHNDLPVSEGWMRDFL